MSTIGNACLVDSKTFSQMTTGQKYIKRKTCYTCFTNASRKGCYVCWEELAPQMAPRHSQHNG